MSQEFDAIYERGVFRPLGRVNLPELSKVHLQVQEVGEPEGRPVGSSDLVGFLADEPELADQIMDDVYRTRDSQSLRTSADGTSDT